MNNTATTIRVGAAGNDAVSGGTNLPGQFLSADGGGARRRCGGQRPSVAISASQTFTLNVVAGGIGIGLGAVGIGLAIVNVDSNVAPTSGRASPSTISSGGSLDVDATHNATLDVVGFAGAESSFVSLVRVSRWPPMTATCRR